jgi:hypothetical protein
MVAGLNHDKDRKAKADRLLVDDGALSDQDPGLLQPADTAPTSVLRQPDRLGDITLGQAAIALQRGKDLVVDMINIHHFSFI